MSRVKLYLILLLNRVMKQSKSRGLNRSSIYVNLGALKFVVSDVFHSLLLTNFYWKI